MTARFAASEYALSAVGCPSVRVSPVADAVIILAVSICVVILRIMMQFM